MPDDMIPPAPPRRLTLPPPYDQHWLADADVMSQAARLAASEGAGTLVWHLGPGHLNFAVVLEPDQPLAEARLAFVAGMVALGDALAAHCPAERAIRFGWPGAVILDAGRLGGARLAVSPGCGEADVPDWLVFGVELIADRDHIELPGAFPNSISLKEEEFPDPAAVVESFAAHLMLQFDRITHEGAGVVKARYDARLDTPMTNLAALGPALGTCDWRDASGPRL